MNIPPNLSQQSLQPMQQPPPPPQQQISQQPQEKLDNISKVKSLIVPLRESLANSLKTAAHTLNQNIINDAQQSLLKGVDDPFPRYDKNMEEFYSICDQIELNLKTSIECMSQSSSSQHYLPLPVVPTRTEPMPNQDTAHSYPQYLCAVRAQIHFTHELHELLRAASQSMIQPE